MQVEYIEYIVAAIGVLVALGFLLRSRATPESADAPSIFPVNSENSESSTSPSPNEPVIEPPREEGIGPAIDRLAKQTNFSIEADHADCKTLIAAGSSSLRALHDKVRASGDTWVLLYPVMAVVAEALGQVGRETLGQLLSEAVAQHHSRLVSFLDHAASKMKPALCEVLCDRVERQCAEAFGDAAAHFGKRAIEIMIARLSTASGEKAVALREMLTATFSSSSFDENKAWRAALKHADSRVRAAAVLADRDEEHLKAIHALAADPDEAVRYALLCRDENLPTPQLLQLAQDASPRVRALVAMQLGGDSPEVMAALQKLSADPHEGVALMAAVALEHPSCDDRILRGIDAPDALVRDSAARSAGYLKGEKYGAALLRLEKSATEEEIAEAVFGATDGAAALKFIAALGLRNPPEKILDAVQTSLAFDDEEGVADLAVPLLAATAPDRVRRVGFYVIAQRRETWTRHLEPLLRPDEPLIEDLIYEIEGALVGEDDVDREMFERIKRRYPGTVLDTLATHALAQK